MIGNSQQFTCSQKSCSSTHHIGPHRAANQNPVQERSSWKLSNLKNKWRSPHLHLFCLKYGQNQQHEKIKLHRKADLRGKGRTQRREENSSLLGAKGFGKISQPLSKNRRPSKLIIHGRLNHCLSQRPPIKPQKNRDQEIKRCKPTMKKRKRNKNSQKMSAVTQKRESSKTHGN